MEEKNDIKQRREQEQTKEEKPDKHVEADQEEKVIPVLEENQLAKDTEKERHENKEEISVGWQTDLSKKSKESSKQNAKGKHTIPQPFSFATCKRMSKERRGSVDFSAANEERRSKEKRGSVDFKDSQPKLSKSVSSKHKVESSASAGQTSKLRRSKSTTANITSAKPEATSTKRADKRIEDGLKTKETIQVKEVESKYWRVNTKKKQGEELEMDKLRKTSTYKTSSLPTFYNLNDPPSKPGKKKIPVTGPKSPVLGQRSKSVSNAQSSKIEEKGKTASKTISSCAKETISKILKGTRKVLNPPKEKVKRVASYA